MQGPGSLELELEWEVDEGDLPPLPKPPKVDPIHSSERGKRGAPPPPPPRDLTQRAVLVVSPWLAYACCEGARIILSSPGETTGKCSTVQRVLRDDTVVVRVDATTKEEIVDPRPDRCKPSSARRYPHGTAIFFLHGDECVDASVAEMPQKEWDESEHKLRDEKDGRRPDLKAGNKHWIQVTDAKGGGRPIVGDLNEFSHCVPLFGTVGEYEDKRVQHCCDIVAKNEKVEDAITGNTLNIRDQLVNVDVKASANSGATNLLLGKAVKDVNVLTAILMMPSP